jgi:hypothetical protein
MSIPDQFRRTVSRARTATDPPTASMPAQDAAASSPAVPARGSWPWLSAALLLSIAAQLITISALESADPIQVTWASLLLAIAPAPLAALAAFGAAPVSRVAAGVAVVVLVAGIAGQVTHTGLFFLPALVVMVVAAIRLWRERT